MQDIMPMPISQTGHNKLKEELSELEKEADDLRIRVAEARDMGDLKENGEYIYGRQNLGFVEGRMGEIRGKINSSETVDCTKVLCDRVDFGAIVTLREGGRLHFVSHLPLILFLNYCNITSLSANEIIRIITIIPMYTKRMARTLSI